MNNPFAALAEPLVFRPGDVEPSLKKAAAYAAKPRREIEKCENPWGLTAAQCEVMRLACDGLSMSQIADKTGVSKKTVGAHMFRLKEKMDAPSLVKAKAIWISHFGSKEEDRMAPLDLIETARRVTT